MSTYVLVAFLALCIVFAVITGFFYRLCTDKEQGCAKLINYLLEKHREERKDLIDRLMARDLKEVKQAQAIQNITPKVVSKRQNDTRIAEEAQKLASSK